MCELISYIKGCSVINRLFLIKTVFSRNYILRFSFDAVDVIIHKSSFYDANGFNSREMIYSYV